MKREVVFGLKAEADLASLYSYIAPRSSPEQAFAYVNRIRTYCLTLHTFPERGTSHPRIRPGVRVIGFEGSVSIAFRVKPKQVIILRILYGGRDLPRSLRQN